MDWKIVILRDAILKSLNLDSIEEVKQVLESSLLETSDHWQERLLGEGKASIDDFFYDYYIGSPSTTICEGDLVSFTNSGAPSGNWWAVDAIGDSHEIKPGTVGIILKKENSDFVDYDFDYQVAIGERIFTDLSDNMFNKPE